MARSAEGRALTEAQRIRQNALAEATGRAVGRGFYRRMDPANIDADRSRWVAEAVARSTASAREAMDRTGTYLVRYAKAEGESLDIVTPTVSAASVAETMTVAGPVAFKVEKKRGLDDATAMAFARTRASAAARGIVMDASRTMTIQTARHNRGRWRRVTDGKPCAFCAMLAGRGPVYAEDTVDFEAHLKCGCTSEVSFETPDEWIAEYATPTEVAWVNAYFDAAEAASKAGQPRVAPVRKAGKGRDTVLARMRRQHPELFHDGVTSKK